MADSITRPGLWVLLLASALTWGCASTPNTFANVAPDADFSQYSTFGFLDKPSTDGERYESMETSFLKVAVAQEMDRRGFSYAESPDLLINFYIHTKEKIRSRSVPTTGAYYGYRDPFYDPWLDYGVGVAYETRIDQYTEGTLNIDVIDAKTNKLVWEGAISGRVTDADIRNLEKTGGVVDAISGATVSSRAAAEAVNRAEQLFREHGEAIRELALQPPPVSGEEEG